MAVALKYALTETLMIPTYEAERDTEEHTPEVAPPRQFASKAEERRRKAQTERPAPSGIGTSPSGDDPDVLVQQTISYCSTKLRAVWPANEGPDREKRMKWYWEQFATPKTAAMPRDWNPTSALLQAAPGKCVAMRVAADKLQDERTPGADDDAA